MLSDSESENNDIVQLTINEHFAKAYEKKKEREELSKLKDKYGSDVEEPTDDSDDSEDTSEDEDGEELTPAVDAAILRTLARIKRKDPSIYETGKDVFQEEQQKTSASAIARKKAREKTKPLLMRQHMLNSQLEGTSRSPSPIPQEPTHVEEQAALRKETINAFHTAVASEKESNVNAGDDDDDIGDFLVPREKTKDEIEQEQEEYREFLAREVGEDIGDLVTVEEAWVNKDAEGDLGGDKTESQGGEKQAKKKKKEKKGKGRSKEEQDHEFLMNYILNRGWIDQSSHHVPTYDEVTGSSSKRKHRDSKTTEKREENDFDHSNGQASLKEDIEASETELLDEEEFDELAENFESSYNFRYEEPGAAVIPTHPRNIESTVRREDNPRKAARERKKERKEQKLLQKREEVKRLKALKTKEIREKLDRIRREGGKKADDDALENLDLEGDWDPDAYDNQMAGLYGKDEDAGAEEDIGKPTWDDDIDITDIVPETSKTKKKKDKKKRGYDHEDEDGVDVDAMDADNINASRMGGKGVDDEIEELDQLDFTDMVGDLPTRFKYTPVLPQSYGMDSVEILLADDADLNEVVGLRALAPYRRDKGRTWDQMRGEKLQQLRKKLHSRYGKFAEGGHGQSEERQAKRRKGKKERLKEKLATAPAVEETPQIKEDSETRFEGGEEAASSKKRKRRHKKGKAT